MASVLRREKPKDLEEYVSRIVSDPNTLQLAQQEGLNVTQVTWEDTARTPGSCWGPNISDMTLSVNDNLMPVVRRLNFSDKTADHDLSSFSVVVGNEVGGELHSIPLKEFIENINQYTGNPNIKPLLTEKDLQPNAVLTSSQACVLPVGDGETVPFNVQLFNYQSVKDDPAVLVILSSSAGTSVQIIEEDEQKLWFNDNGQRAPFTIQRLADRRKELGQEAKQATSYKDMDQSETSNNSILMIQVPLKRRTQDVKRFSAFGGGCPPGAMCAMLSFDDDLGDEMECSLGMDMGHLATGETVGPFEGVRDLPLERDDRFQIRITMQWYRATDLPRIDEKSMQDIKAQLEEVYGVSEKVGSLVVGDTDRITAPDLSKPKPSDNPFQKFTATTPQPAPVWGFAKKPKEDVEAHKE